MASLMSRKTSSREALTAAQPGRSGTCAPQLSGPFSMMTAYLMQVPSFETGLFEDGIEGSGRNVDARFSSKRHRTPFPGMFELSVASSGPGQNPPVVFEYFDDCADFHQEDLPP